MTEEIELFKDVHLGNGAFGIVCKAKYDQLPCAAKLLHPTFLVPGNWAVDKFMQECSFLSSLKHPHIVQFLGVHTDKSTGQAVLLMELMDESLTTFLKRHKSSNQLAPLHIQIDISHDISLALHYLHTKGIIHRDLSSNNILLLGGCCAKITDFGMSKLTLNVSPSAPSLSSLTQVPGCPVYMPPEAWLSPPVYTEKLDIFSYGVLLLQIATCNQPNPGPLESLIPDERSPTGYLKLPVPEVTRRSEDIALVVSTWPLLEVMMACLSDKQDNRPSAKDLCGIVESTKSSFQYTESKFVAHPMTTLRIDSSDSGYRDTSSTGALHDEMHSLKSTISTHETSLAALQTQLLNKDSEIEQLKKQLKEEAAKSTVPASTASEAPTVFMQSSIEQKTVHNLSPEILSILRKDSNMCKTFNIDYDRDSVTFYQHTQKDDNDRSVRLFLQMYQHIFNTGEAKVNFVLIPKTFPKEMLNDLIPICAREHNECIFELIEEANVIKVLSKSSALNQLSTQLVTNMLNLSIKLPGDRSLVLVNARVVDQKADILACSVNPNVSHNNGIEAILNTMSNFELQKLCSQYVQKNGPLKPGQAMHVPASGSLQCNWVIHFVGPSTAHNSDKQIEAARNEIEKILKNALASIFERAEKLKATSLAVHALSSTVLGNKESTKLIVNFVTQYKFHSLKKVTFAVDRSRYFPDICRALLESGAVLTKKEYCALSDTLSSSKSCKHQ